MDPGPARRIEDQYSDLATRQILLILQALIGGDQKLEASGFCLGKQLPVAKRLPAQLKCGGDEVSVEKATQWTRSTLIEQHPHSGNVQGSRRVLQYRAGLLKTYTGKPLDNVGELGPVLQVLKKSRNGNTSAAKYPGTTDALRISLNGVALGPIDHGLMLRRVNGVFNASIPGIF